MDFYEEFGPLILKIINQNPNGIAIEKIKYVLRNDYDYTEVPTSNKISRFLKQSSIVKRRFGRINKYFPKQVEDDFSNYQKIIDFKIRSICKSHPEGLTTRSIKLILEKEHGYTSPPKSHTISKICDKLGIPKTKRDGHIPLYGKIKVNDYFPDKDEVLKFIYLHPGLTLQEIIDGTGWDFKKLQKSLYNYKYKNYVEDVSSSGPSIKYQISSEIKSRFEDGSKTDIHPITKREKVYEFVKDNPGLTALEISTNFPDFKYSVHPNLSHLRDENKLKNDDSKPLKWYLIDEPEIKEVEAEKNEKVISQVCEITDISNNDIIEFIKDNPNLTSKEIFDHFNVSSLSGMRSKLNYLRYGLKKIDYIKGDFSRWFAVDDENQTKVGKLSIDEKKDIVLLGKKPSKEEVLKFIENNPGLTIKQIGDGLGCNFRRLTKSLVVLRDKGKLVSRGNRPFKWSIREKEDEYQLLPIEYGRNIIEKRPTKELSVNWYERGYIRIPEKMLDLINESIEESGLYTDAQEYILEALRYKIIYDKLNDNILSPLILSPREFITQKSDQLRWN